MAKKVMKNIIVLSVIALIVVLFYYADSNSDNGTGGSEEKSEVEEIISRDFDKSYPDTPKAVVSMYSDIIKCFYGEKYSDKEMKKLAKQAQRLMDDELLERNKFEDYYKNLSDDVDSYKADDKEISSFFVESGDDVKYKTFQNREYAFVECTYYTKGKEGTAKVPEEYILRQGDDGEWKILYWKMVSSNEE